MAPIVSTLRRFNRVSIDSQSAGEICKLARSGDKEAVKSSLPEPQSVINLTRLINQNRPADINLIYDCSGAGISRASIAAERELPRVYIYKYWNVLLSTAFFLQLGTRLPRLLNSIFPHSRYYIVYSFSSTKACQRDIFRWKTRNEREREGDFERWLQVTLQSLGNRRISLDVD